MARLRAAALAAAMVVGTACITAAHAQGPAAPDDGGRAEAEARAAADANEDATTENVNEGPDLAFLEYLGSWQADDDEWLLIAEWHEDEAADAAKDEGGTRAERRAAAEAEARRERAKRKDDEEGD